MSNDNTSMLLSNTLHSTKNHDNKKLDYTAYMLGTTQYGQLGIGFTNK